MICSDLLSEAKNGSDFPFWRERTVCSQLALSRHQGFSCTYLFSILLLNYLCCGHFESLPLRSKVLWVKVNEDLRLSKHRLGSGTF